MFNQPLYPLSHKDIIGVFLKILQSMLDSFDISLKWRVRPNSGFHFRDGIQLVSRENITK